MNYLKREMVTHGVELGPGNVLSSLMKHNISDIKIYAYDKEEEQEKLRAYIEKTTIPFLSRCLGIAVATKNNNWKEEDYQTGVKEPYEKIRQMEQRTEEENRKATREEMEQAMELLKKIFETKQTEKEEQEMRFKQLFRDTGTEDIFLKK
ncbi:hypothetical protein [Anaeromicropila populeti]|uniref:[acyl-carrier-protein] S-malonyltransferase n=1 Tax=Anaeromicropila populeti TaxID=37658 RepID=A0A1I6LYT6_9FIRM|nr:hypothetical protein [Anaeromicropila populeti]SFS08607.1 [acyl-carrier-protein] S-malonyltransferase [Anaeromicropila populeti]